MRPAYPRLCPALAGACVLAATVALAAPGSAQQAESSTAPATAPSFGAEVPSVADGTLSTQGRDRRLVFTVLLGAQTRPVYFGANETEVAPLFRPNVLAFDFGRIDLGDGALADDPLERPLGFAFGPSFRYIGDRNADDHDELAGLEDIDATFELGAQVGYIWPSVEAFGQLRYGFGGSEAWVGELGAYYVTRPADNFALRIGPRLLFGTDDYSDTYFGVSADEAAASGLSEFDPDGGLLRAGVEVIATYRLGEQWWLEGRARWDQFQDDAADSPIVRQGARDQGTVSIGVRRAFVLEF
ncbi:MAG: MipA/OmpV family protein [Paracoccaceae bacterium]|nr:MipA/OmpV family protein [Paracoccaceae bacterium]